MLPMRCAASLLVALAALGIAGCKNQATGSFTNPFLTPDRVPPPSTRVLAPGTAQPYYPGDPVPGAAPVAGAPAYGAPAVGAPAATPVYGGGVSPPLTTPPGGWGYPPQSRADARGESVGVPGDDQQLRFAEADVPAPKGFTPVSPLTFTAPPTAKLPIQSMLPLGGDGPTPQRLATREVTQAEYLEGVGAAAGVTRASAPAMRDGFRPQGSAPRDEDDADESFRPPEIRREAVEAAASQSALYGSAPNHEWIRGQLEYWPDTGAWSLRYVPQETPPGAGDGRVMIANPQVLANLSAGELVMVQGQLFAQPVEGGAYQQAYRVAAVQRQRR
jgi:hypothetical protein